MASPAKEKKKEKPVYYSSRGGAGRSKSVHDVIRKTLPATTTAPAKALEVPIPRDKTTTHGRGGTGNARTFVVEEGTFERVIEYETGQIRAMKSEAAQRKSIGLRGGFGMPKKFTKSPKNPPRLELKTGNEPTDEDIDFASLFPSVPSISDSVSSRGRTPSVMSTATSSSDRHCTTCQCWRSSEGTPSLLSPESSLPSPASPFRPYAPGVLLYVPEGRRGSGPPSPTFLPYLHDTGLLSPSPEPR